MNIALWEGVVDYFKIEIIHFMIDTSHKFAVNNNIRTHDKYKSAIKGDALRTIGIPSIYLKIHPINWI